MSKHAEMFENLPKMFLVMPNICIFKCRRHNFTTNLVIQCCVNENLDQKLVNVEYLCEGLERKHANVSEFWTFAFGVPKFTLDGILFIFLIDHCLGYYQ